MRILFACILILSQSACISFGEFRYQVSASQPPKLDGKTIVVLPFEDCRSGVNNDWSALALLPLFPWGTNNMNMPEVILNGQRALNVDPLESFPKALASDLQNSGLFGDAFFGYQRTNANLFISGKLHQTSFDTKLFTYGLSFLGIYTWYLGAPALHTSSSLTIEYALADSKTGAIIYKKTYTTEPIGKYIWLYKPRRDTKFDTLLKKINDQFITDLKAQNFS